MPFVGFIVFVAVLALVYHLFFNADKRLKRRILQLPIASSIAETPENQDIRVSGTLAYVEGKPPLRARLRMIGGLRGD